MSSTRTVQARAKQAGHTVYDSQAYANGETILATPCQLLKLVVTSKSASALWLALFNGPTATGTPAIAPMALPANTSVTVDLSTNSGEGWCGIPFGSSLTWAASSAAVFAQDSTSSLWVTAIYIA